MSKILIFPMKHGVPFGGPDLRRDDMNWSKLTDDVQATCVQRLKTTIRPEYKSVLKLLQDKTQSKERIKFLEKVKSSFETYLFSEKNIQIEHPLYYLLMYYLEMDSDEFYIEVDEEDVVHMSCHNTKSNRVVAFMINQFRETLSQKNNYSTVEMFLSYVNKG